MMHRRVVSFFFERDVRVPSVRAGATMEPKNTARFGTTRRFLRAVFRAVVRANDAEWPFERGFRSARSQALVPAR